MTDNYPKVTQKITALINELEDRLFHMPLARELCLLAREGLAARQLKASAFTEPKTVRWNPKEQRWGNDPHDEVSVPKKLFTLRKTL